MSLSNIVVQQVYVADGGTTDFAIPFAFTEGNAEDVTKVYTVDPVTGIKTLKVFGALNDYTLSPPPPDPSPSLVVFNIAPLVDLLVLVRRSMPLQQAVEYVNSGQMLLSDIALGLDELCMELQQIAEDVSRSAKLNDVHLPADFDMTLPFDMKGSSNLTIGTNIAGDGFEMGPSFDDIENAILYAAQALASQMAAAASAANALASETAAALSAAAAAISAAAAALTGGFTGSGPFAILDGQAATDLLGEIFDGTLISSVEYFYEVIRGITVMTNGQVIMQYKNGIWGIESAGEIGDNSGLTFSVAQIGTTGQLKVALDAGAGNGTLKLKKISYVA